MLKTLYPIYSIFSIISNLMAITYSVKKYLIFIGLISYKNEFSVYPWIVSSLNSLIRYVYYWKKASRIFSFSYSPLMNESTSWSSIKSNIYQGLDLIIDKWEYLFNNDFLLDFCFNRGHTIAFLVSIPAKLGMITAFDLIRNIVLREIVDTFF